MKPDASSDMSNKGAADKAAECTSCGYCGRARNLNIVELQCSACARFHHESCISYQLGKLVPFLTNYMFTCRSCSNTGLETFRKLQAQSSQMCMTALANLQQTATKDQPGGGGGGGRRMFSLNEEIVPWIEMHWEAMTTLTRRSTHSWKQTIQRTLLKDTGSLFVCEESSPSQPPLTDGTTVATATTKYPMYGLKQTDLSLVRPNYSLLKQRHNDNVKNRGPKRKQQEPTGGAKKSRTDGALVQKLHGYPLDHPFNKDGYRYILTEPDPNAPFRQEFDETSDSSSRPIPGWLHRAQCPSAVLLSLHDRAPCLKVSDDRLTVSGDKGYCVVRATHAVSSGTWYWEAAFTRQPDGAHVRLGWAQPLANLNAPLGYDKLGYSWRSRKGTVFHEARGRSFSEGFVEGDVLGLLIHLADTQDNRRLPDSFKDRPLIKWKSHLYFEDKDDMPATLAALQPSTGSHIDFFKNGKRMGRAFSNILRGDYCPAISLYRGAVITANFGPSLAFPPDNTDYRMMYERAEEHTIQQAMADIAWLAEHDGKLSIDP